MEAREYDVSTSQELKAKFDAQPITEATRLKLLSMMCFPEQRESLNNLMKTLCVTENEGQNPKFVEAVTRKNDLIELESYHSNRVRGATLSVTSNNFA